MTSRPTQLLQRKQKPQASQLSMVPARSTQPHRSEVPSQSAKPFWSRKPNAEIKRASRLGIITVQGLDYQVKIERAGSVPVLSLRPYRGRKVLRFALTDVIGWLITNT